MRHQRNRLANRLAAALFACALLLGTASAEGFSSFQDMLNRARPTQAPTAAPSAAPVGAVLPSFESFCGIAGETYTSTLPDGEPATATRYQGVAEEIFTAYASLLTNDGGYLVEDLSPAIANSAPDLLVRFTNGDISCYATYEFGTGTLVWMLPAAQDVSFVSIEAWSEYIYGPSQIMTHNEALLRLPQRQDNVLHALIGEELVTFTLQNAVRSQTEIVLTFAQYDGSRLLATLVVRAPNHEREVLRVHTSTEGYDYTKYVHPSVTYQAGGVAYSATRADGFYGGCVPAGASYSIVMDATSIAFVEGAVSGTLVSARGERIVILAGQFRAGT